ncbi:NlpC/P60 family protein [Paracoccus lutimaris]|uniref:NlpC/P60 family putative phage cell wall peptidase n=1 Tax=Paracoccus lutimaris TaxID=1490030 RepID=A0A368YZY2_9RHOB|nr:NlpC/P60 family protein [Paracoccus lutimaris]RCW85772.1 NlpC/P60 family putative phage cell wall peptidase [Paracoccus lutimaris]
MSREIVQAARGWIGTPYVHQASVKGGGTDCLGLVRGVWREFFGIEPEAMPAYTPDWGEIGGSELLLGGAGRFLQPAPDEQPGDVLVFRMRAGAVAKHMGILAQTGAEASFVHAYDRHGVVESPLSAPWRARIAGRFRFPSI